MTRLLAALAVVSTVLFATPAFAVIQGCLPDPLPALREPRDPWPCAGRRDQHGGDSDRASLLRLRVSMRHPSIPNASGGSEKAFCDTAERSRQRSRVGRSRGMRAGLTSPRTST